MGFSGENDDQKNIWGSQKSGWTLTLHRPGRGVDPMLSLDAFH